MVCRYIVITSRQIVLFPLLLPQNMINYSLWYISQDIYKLGYTKNIYLYIPENRVSFTRFSKLSLYVFDVTLMRSILSVNRLELRYYAAGAEKQTPRQ